MALSDGVCWPQMGIMYGQRGWKLQPLGVSRRLGTSPMIGMSHGGVCPGGVAAATKVAVYGCLGCRQTSLALPTSTNLPRYITPIHSLMSSTVARSWLM